MWVIYLRFFADNSTVFCGLASTRDNASLYIKKQLKGKEYSGSAWYYVTEVKIID